MAASFSNPDQLASALAELTGKVETAEKRAEQAEIRARLAEMRVLQLEETLRLMRIDKYGPQSESLTDAQLRMFDEEPGVSLDEVAAEAARGPLPPVPPAQPKKNRKPHPGRQTLPADLPRVVETVACAAAQCTCGRCGAETTVIGYEESERLNVEPPKFYVEVTRREKRACASCRQNGVATAAIPPQIIEKGLPGNHLVVQTVVAKYCDHLPLYRQSAMVLRDAGVAVSRVTMDGWVMKAGELLTPIAQAMWKELLAERYLQADETTVPVQRPELKKGSNHQAYLWQFGKPEGSCVFFFHLGRGGEIPRQHLAGYTGILQTDGYAGYNRAGGEGMVHAGCWAHARRGFVEALQLNPLDRDAAEMVKRMNALFAVDRQAREDRLTVEARHELRWLKAPGLLAEIRTQAQRLREQVLPKSKLGEAVTYLLGQWERLIAFQDHPVLELSNNLAENSMRPAVLGRRNWIHVGSVDAGPKVAAILSVVETCRRIGVPVREYLMNVLPGLGERPMADIPGLTPARWAAARSV